MKAHYDGKAVQKKYDKGLEVSYKGLHYKIQAFMLLSGSLWSLLPQSEHQWINGAAMIFTFTQKVR